MNNYEPYFDIAALIAKHLKGETTYEEEQQLQQWLGADPHNRELFDKLNRSVLIEQQLKVYNHSDKEKAWINITERTGFEKKIKNHKPLQFFAYAASVLFLLGVGMKFAGIFYQGDKTDRTTPKHAADLMPGGNKAVLTLADGSTITLDSNRKGQIARQQNVTISVKAGEIVYNNNSGSDTPSQKDLGACNTITTPRAGQFSVVLPDGSKVWLNAASSLKYPVNFTGKERKVELSGEGYFEVAHNPARPFIVNTAGQTVKVLGTHFDIDAYKDDGNIKTTLFEGSVKITNGSGTQSLRLTPGEQALNTTGKLSLIPDADTGEAIAWKEGKFLFHNTDLMTIMKEISRWYDVEVEYQGKITPKHYIGRISRNVPVSQIFEILKTSGINFTINGRKIIVRS